MQCLFLHLPSSLCLKIISRICDKCYCLIIQLHDILHIRLYKPEPPCRSQTVKLTFTQFASRPIQPSSHDVCMWFVCPRLILTILKPPFGPNVSVCVCAGFYFKIRFLTVALLEIQPHLIGSVSFLPTLGQPPDCDLDILRSTWHRPWVTVLRRTQSSFLKSFVAYPRTTWTRADMAQTHGPPRSV